MSQQRRVVTVLFADVVGSTSIGEHLDPEDLRSLLTRYFAIAREVIDEFGGTLEKFVGDAVMAMFGVPTAHDDDVRRALSAALELRSRMQADPRLATRLPIRIGVNTGDVASGADEATGEELVAGDAVNVAARIQQGAGPWSIVVGERTAAAAGASFSFGPPIDLEARGRSALVGARELLGARPASGWVTPFFGRESDLEQLDLVARRVFNERRAWSVTIVAPPGTGKSRLLAEFLDHLPATEPAPRVARAQCLPYGQRLSYWALGPLLRDLIGVATDSPPEGLIDAAREWLTNAGVAEPQRTGELLATTVGAGAATHPSEAELFAAWRTLFDAAAHQAPLVLALEDLHWSSDSLLDLLDYAIEPRREVSTLLIAIARPELLERRPSWGAGRRNQTTIDLTALDADSMAGIVRHLMPSAASDTVEAIVDRAEGNPFFATEMARSVLEQTGEIVPDTIQGTIQSRIDLLAPGDRAVLQAGAVFGRSFTSAGVGAVIRRDPAEVGASIDRLIARDLVTMGDDGEAHARHILIRDVAYGGLSRIDRARAHAAAAEWLSDQSVESGDATGLIAFHFREAAVLMSAIDDPPPELPSVREQAVDWLGQAADRALAAAASGDAVDNLQAAIELADPTALPPLYERLGDTNLQGELTADAYRRGFELATKQDLGADLRLRIAGKLLMQYTRAQGALANRPSADEVERLRDAGRSLVDMATDQQAIARFLIAEAFVPFWAPSGGNQAAARESAKRGLRIAEGLGEADLRSAALDALTALSDTWPVALRHARRRLHGNGEAQLAERLDAHAVVAWCAAVSGELNEADVASAAGLGLVQPGQVPTYALHIAVWRIYALRLLGRWDEVEEVAEKALELWFATGREPAGFALRGFFDAILVCGARRRTEQAERFAQAAEEILDAFPLDHPIRRLSVFLDSKGETAAGYLADPALVISELHVLGRADYAERAVGICNDHGWRLPVPDLNSLLEEARRQGCLVLEAQLTRALAWASDDNSQIVEALAICERIDAAPLAARIRVELGRLSGDDRLMTAGVAAIDALGDAEYRELMG